MLVQLTAKNSGSQKRQNSKFRNYSFPSQAGEKAKKRKALLEANKVKEEKEREEAVDQCAR